CQLLETFGASQLFPNISRPTLQHLDEGNCFYPLHSAPSWDPSCHRTHSGTGNFSVERRTVYFTLCQHSESMR
ncbi:4203_t:CDS:1, partial [Acaulospora colombiana]